MAVRASVRRTGRSPVDAVWPGLASPGVGARQADRRGTAAVPLVTPFPLAMFNVCRQNERGERDACAHGDGSGGRCIGAGQAAWCSVPCRAVVVAVGPARVRQPRAVPAGTDDRRDTRLEGLVKGQMDDLHQTRDLDETYST